MMNYSYHPKGFDTKFAEVNKYCIIHTSPNLLLFIASLHSFIIHSKIERKKDAWLRCPDALRIGFAFIRLVNGSVTVNKS